MFDDELYWSFWKSYSSRLFQKNLFNKSKRSNFKSLFNFLKEWKRKEKKLNHKNIDCEKKRRNDCQNELKIVFPIWENFENDGEWKNVCPDQKLMISIFLRQMNRFLLTFIWDSNKFFFSERPKGIIFIIWKGIELGLMKNRIGKESVG